MAKVSEFKTQGDKIMHRSIALAMLFSAILGIVGCSKEESEGPAEEMGRKIDETVDTMQERVTEAAEATREQADETKAALGAAMEEKGKEMQTEAEASDQ